MSKEPVKQFATREVEIVIRPFPTRARQLEAWDLVLALCDKYAPERSDAEAER